MKRFISLFTCIAMLFMLCACGPSRPSAESVVEDTINLVINYDTTQGVEFYGDDNTSEDGASTTDGLSIETYAKFVQNISYNIISSEEDESNGSAVVTVEITNIDLATVMGNTILDLFNYLMTFVFLPESAQPTDEQQAQKMEEILNSYLDEPNLDKSTKTVTVNLSLIEDAWVINNEYELGDALYGGMLSYLDSIGEESDTSSKITYDTEGVLGDYAVKINDIEISEDAENDPMVVVNYTWINNSSETTSAGSSVYVQVFQNGIAQEYTWSYDNKYNNNEYTDVRPGTTLEIQSLFKLENTTDPIEVEISLFDGFSDECVLKTFELNQ